MGFKFDQETINQALIYAKEYGVKAASDKFGISRSNISYHIKKGQEVLQKKTSKVIKPKKPASELAKVEGVTFTPAEDREYHRGDIYYIHRYSTTGNEIATGRPAVIISNDRLNEKLKVVEVVFLTSKPKQPAPEHVTINSTGKLSTVICEQITSVDKDCIGNFLGVCTPDEMKRLDAALLSSLELSSYADKRMSDDQVILRLTDIKAERDTYKRMYDDLFERIIKERK